MRKSCILVTGSRNENDQDRIQYGFRLAGSILRLNCAGGRDSVTIYAFPADWEKHGKGAGPIRNQKMVDYVISIQDEYFPVCLAFPREGSIGTWDCVKRAHKAGITVVVCP